MLLAESSLLGLVGGGLGVGLAFALVEMIVRLAPADFPRIAEVELSGGVLLYAVVATIGSTLIAGVVPASRASRVDGSTCLGGSVRGTGTRVTGRLTSVLVGTQVALAVVVAVGAGLMLRSLGELLAVDPGIDGTQVLTLRPIPPGGRYTDGDAFRSYYGDVIEQIAAVPGVESVGAIQLLPGTDGNWSFPTFPQGVDLAEGSPTPSVNFRAVRPDYFETVRIPLRDGRLITTYDHGDSEAVAVVNEAFVDRFWAGQSPLGRSVRLFRRDATPYRVVGVVGDVRQHSRAVEPRPEMYFAHDQVPWDQMAMWIMARVSTGAPLDYAAAIQAAVWAVDPDVPIAGLDDMSSVLGRSTHTTRFLALLLTSLGFFALLLGGIGVFGVTAYTVGQRVPEFGVRVALGSSRSGVLSTALRRSFAPVVVGLSLGLTTAAVASRLLDTVLYEVTATDPVTFLSVTGVLGGIALLAVLLPAWHASAVDPVAALKVER